MEEIVFWKEVPESEVPDDNDKDYWFVEDKYGKGVFLKRVVIPILSDQEIGTNHFSDCEAVGSWVNTESKCNCKERKEAYLSSYKAMQERFLDLK